MARTVLSAVLLLLAAGCGPGETGIDSGAADPEAAFEPTSGAPLPTIRPGSADAPPTGLRAAEGWPSGEGAGAGLADGASSADANADGLPELSWGELAELDLDTGTPSPLLAGLDGSQVRIPGFMVPLDDAAASVREFLLVPYAGACIHVPPPPPNQIVHVQMVDGRSTDVVWWEPIWAHGSLHIDDVAHAYGSASYRMEGVRITAYTEGPPTPEVGAN